jgi:hypothetical protein
VQNALSPALPQHDHRHRLVVAGAAERVDQFLAGLAVKALYFSGG